MKFICFLFMLSFAFYQPKPADPVEHTIGLLKQSNWQELYKTLAPSVDLTIMDVNDIYAKDQAQVILTNFFNKNQPFGLKLVHKVESNPDYRYAVTTLSCKNGDFRLSFSVRNNNGVFQVNEIHIEMEKMK